MAVNCSSRLVCYLGLRGDLRRCRRVCCLCVVENSDGFPARYSVYLGDSLKRKVTQWRDGYAKGTVDKVKHRLQLQRTEDPGGTYEYIEPGETNRGLVVLMVCFTNC